MSCGSSCPCHFKWLVDTQGSKRDPINSEKAWLDFAVRFLSREVVGKAKGQETVWSERCKPLWWDKVVEFPWKNPTANPKDTKEVLLTKYTALESKLREEGRFPQELEEEAKLWNEGKYKELFLQTSLASLLGKVTGVHTAVIDALEKAKELKAQVNQSLVNDLQQCLSSTLRVTNNLAINGNDRNTPTKRSSPGINISNTSGGKQRKIERDILPLDKQSVCSTAPMSLKASQGISLQKELTPDRKCQTKTNTAKRYKQQPQTKPATLVPTIVPRLTTVANSLHQAVSTGGLGFPQENTNHHFLRKIILCTSPALNTTPHFTPTTVLHSQTQATNSFKLLQQTNPGLNPPVPVQLTPNSNTISENTDFLFSSDVPNSPKFHTISENTHNSNITDSNFVSSPVENSSNGYGNIPFTVHGSQSTNSLHSPLLDENDKEISNTSSSVNEPSTSSLNTAASIGITSSSGRAASIGFTSDSDRNISDTDYNTEHSMLEYSTENSMIDYSPEHSILEHSKEHSVLDLDAIFSPYEQEQLWKEDGSYLLERFLEDLGGPEQSSILQLLD